MLELNSSHLTALRTIQKAINLTFAEGGLVTGLNLRDDPNKESTPDVKHFLFRATVRVRKDYVIADGGVSIKRHCESETDRMVRTQWRGYRLAFHLNGGPVRTVELGDMDVP